MIIVKASYYDDIRTRLFAESPQGTCGKSCSIDNAWFRKAHFRSDVPRKQGKKRASKRALDEGTRQQQNGVEPQRSRTLKAQHTEIVEAVPLPALFNSAPRCQGQKCKRSESLPEGEYQSPRLGKRREWAANIDRHSCMLEVQGTPAYRSLVPH